MRKQKVVQVNETQEYVITQLDAKRGLQLFKKLQKVLTPAVFGSLKETKNEQGEDVVNIDMVNMIASISSQLDDFDTDEIIKAIAYSIEKQEQVVSEEFAGKYAELAKLFLEIVIFNFNDAFISLGFDMKEILKG